MLIALANESKPSGFLKPGPFKPIPRFSVYTAKEFNAGCRKPIPLNISIFAAFYFDVIISEPDEAYHTRYTIYISNNYYWLQGKYLKKSITG